MKPTGIPTVYKGRQYRSRLEARWACFFDLVGWPFEYEPFDLNGWIPDFMLLGATSVLVEIKPVTTFPSVIAEEIERSGAEHECLILGCTIPIRCMDIDDTYPEYQRSFGWLTQEGLTDYDIGMYWGDAILGRWKAGNGKIGFCHSSASFEDRVSGGYDGGCFGELGFSHLEAIQLWTHAGNLTQWKGKQSIVR